MSSFRWSRRLEAKRRPTPPDRRGHPAVRPQVGGPVARLVPAAASGIANGQLPFNGDGPGDADKTVVNVAPPLGDGGTKDLIPAGAATRPALSREARVLLRDRSNSIRGFAELLAEDSGLTTRNRRFVMNILASVNRLLVDLDREESDRPSDRVESAEGGL